MRAGRQFSLWASRPAAGYMVCGRGPTGHCDPCRKPDPIRLADPLGSKSPPAQSCSEAPHRVWVASTRNRVGVPSRLAARENSRAGSLPRRFPHARLRWDGRPLRRCIRTGLAWPLGCPVGSGAMSCRPVDVGGPGAGGPGRHVPGLQEVSRASWKRPVRGPSAVGRRRGGIPAGG